MNQKEKLTEATMLAIQGKLTEDISKEEAKELIQYYKKSKDYDDFDITYVLNPLIKDNISAKQIRNIMDQHKSYPVYKLPIREWSEQQKLELNDIICNYLQKNKTSSLSQNESQLFSSFIKKGISIKKIAQLCKLFPSAGKLRLASKAINNKELSEKFINDNTSDEEMLQIIDQLSNVEKEQNKNTLKIRPKVTYNARITSQEYGGGQYRQTEHWKLIENKLLEILPELYKEGWEYVNSELYIRVIYNFMNSDADSLMRLTINLNKDELTKSIVMTTNMSKEPSENNLNIQM